MKITKYLSKYLSLLFFSLFAVSGFAGSGHSHSHENVYGEDSDFDYGHTHSHTPHHGIVKPLKSAAGDIGFIELKLHDDKGDLELWITADEKGQPFDIALGSKIKVTFLDLDKIAMLRVRNTDQNEDEDGQGNIRNDKTNYFIFPSLDGESADFLKGKSFSSNVVVSFEMDGERYQTDSFVLVPHTH